ncbi:MAG TPA: methyltransferase domain-containing protein [Burkholderiaceae bacterium]|nr:methyltransferase domain-containing protein [Burkholderiaceae bacterium]
MPEPVISATPKDVWASGAPYEAYVGRWSRRVATQFLHWLMPAPERVWLDVGCGTGALTQTILAAAAPGEVQGIDPSEGFVAHARAQVRDPRAAFLVGDAQALPFEPERFDFVVAGLVLNFIPQPARAVAEMARVARAGGTVACYVWDYAGKMQLMRHFWNAVVALEPAAADLDEGRRFPLCAADALQSLFEQAALDDVAVCAIDIDTHFNDFDDYWSPFLGGQGPAPAYARALSEEKRAALRERIRAGLPFALDGSIPLAARAWAVRGRR